MMSELVEMEREVIDAITNYGTTDLSKLKNILYDKTKNPYFLSEDTVKRLVERYARTEFKILGWINTIEEEEIRRGNYSIQLSPKMLEPRLHIAKITNEKDYVEDNDHVLFPENLEHFLNSLGEKGLLISLPQEKTFVFRSKTAELIRLMLELPVRKWDRDKKQYWFDSSVATVKYHRQVKKVPSWDREIQDVTKEILEEAKTHFVKHGKKFVYEKLKKEKGQDIFIRCTKSTLEGFQDFVSNKYGIKKEHVKLSDFQVKCIKETLRTKFVRDYTYPKDLVMTAGVASGKTFAFLLGPLIYILYEKYRKERLRNYSPVVRCLIMYPRVALSKDQYDTIRGLQESVNKRSLYSFNLQVTIRAVPDFAGELSGGKTVYAGLKDADNKKPDIWISNTETLKRRIKNPGARGLFAGFLEFIILDEIHLYRGIEGNHVSKLMERILGRIRQKAYYKKHRPMFIGSSATIAHPIEHCSKIFPETSYGHIQHITASEFPSLADYGVFHHILVKAREGRSLLGTLTDLTSCVLHNRFEDLTKINSLREKASKEDDIATNLPKIVGFSDSLTVVSRWKDLVRDQEKSFWKGFWERGKQPKKEHTREFPFYAMFYKPFLWRLKVVRYRASQWGGDITNQEYESLTKRFETLCDNCKSGKRDSFDLVDYMAKSKSDFITQNILPTYTVPREIDSRISNLDKCPFFSHGLCWWFSEDSATRFESYPTESGEVECYADNIRTRISTSRVRETVQNPNEEFMTNFYGAFGSPIVCNQRISFEGKIPFPFLISSPVLEVGVDISNVKGTILHKAIRNLSSYKQKIGRSGREMLSQSHAITLVSFDPREQYYYRNSYMLADPTILDPIPLKRRNVDIEKSHALETCFDFFASLEWDIYNIPSNRRDFDADHKNFPERIKLLLKSSFLNKQNGKFKDNSLLEYIVRTIGVSEDLAGAAISKFREYISFFASDTISKQLDNKEENLATLWESVIEKKLVLSTPQIKKTEISDLQNLKDLVGEAILLVQSLKNDGVRQQLVSILEKMEVSK